MVRLFPHKYLEICLNLILDRKDNTIKNELLANLLPYSSQPQPRLLDIKNRNRGYGDICQSQTQPQPRL